MPEGKTNEELDNLRFKVLSGENPSQEDIDRLNQLIIETGEAEEIELDE